MANCNSLLALAYIRESDNPLSVISNLILYCLHNSPSGELRYDDLKNKMDEYFVRIPHHVIDCCLKYLYKNGEIQKLPQGAGYKIVSSTFNIEKFNYEKSVLASEEDRFATGLCEYVDKNYHLVWDKNKAIDRFSALVLNDNFSETILEKDCDQEKPKYVSDTWYVKNYIMFLIENKTDINYDYFLKVFNGKIVLTGLTQISDYNQNKSQKFRGTAFYFDTKIMLRVLGFSAPFYIETSLELVRLIQDEYEGEICVFEHVVMEMKHSLTLAYHDLLDSDSIVNYEMDVFRKTSNYKAEDFKIAADSIEKIIIEDWHFRIVPDIDWNSIRTKTYCIDTESLHAFITTANPTWSEKAIKNDVYAIAQINIERKSDYSINFGGKQKLPIFVTSNNKLISDVRRYTFDCIENSIGLPWCPNRIPMINDYDLTCRLWLTSSTKEPISLNLIKSAYLYQQSDAAFFEKIRSTYDDVKKKHKLNIIDLDYERFEKLKDLIIDNTSGNIDDITEDVVAMSFEELAKRQSIDKDETILDLEKDKKESDKKICNLTDQIIESASARFIDKVGIWDKLIHWSINNLPWIIGIIGVIIGFVIDSIITNEFMSKGKLFALIPIAVSAVFVFIDKKLLNDSIIEKLSSKHKDYIKGKFQNKILYGLSDNEKEYQERIILNCIRKTSFFDKPNVETDRS